jgi:hypothetical protein
LPPIFLIADIRELALEESNKLLQVSNLRLRGCYLRRFLSCRIK